MLKNANVRQVILNTAAGSCRIIMENREQYWNTDIYFQIDFLDYIRSLAEEDQLIFTDATTWILVTDDPWEDWEEAYRHIGALSVMNLMNGQQNQRVILRG